MKKLYKSNKSSGFTIVEIVVVVIVVGILVSIGVVSYGSWRTDAAEQQVMSDLKNAAAAMEGAAINGDTYPSSIPATFVSSDDVNITYKNGNARYFCLEGRSPVVGGLVYYANSTDALKSPKKGTCPSVPPIANEPLVTPVMTGVAVSSSQAVVAWESVSGAAQYEVRYRRGSDAWVSRSRVATLSDTITGLSLGYGYEFQVRAINSASTSQWSSSSQRQTVPTPVISGYGDMGCGNSGGTNAWKKIQFYFAPTSNLSTVQYKAVGLDTYIGGSNNGTAPTVTGKTTSWPANASGSGNIVITAIGPNGETSAPITWTSPVYPAYEC